MLLNPRGLLKQVFEPYNFYAFILSSRIFPERLGEGRFLGAVSLSSLT